MHLDAWLAPQCNNSTWTAGVATYGSAGQLLTVGSGGITGVYRATASVSETRTYNNMLQLTHLVSSALGYEPPNTYTGGGVDTLACVPHPIRLQYRP